MAATIFTETSRNSKNFIFENSEFIVDETGILIHPNQLFVEDMVASIIDEIITSPTDIVKRRDREFLQTKFWDIINSAVKISQSTKKIKILDVKIIKVPEVWKDYLHSPKSV